MKKSSKIFTICLVLVSILLLSLVLAGCNVKVLSKSAYEIAVEKGFQGTEQEWLDSLRGEKGDDGRTPIITIGPNGNWLINGENSGIPATGPVGPTGPQGIIPHIGENGNWFIGDKDTGEQALKTVEIKDGYWVVEGVPTTEKVRDDITLGENGNWFINGVDTEVQAQGNDGITPYINEEGFWVVNNAPTEIKARGPKGDEGKSAYDLYKEIAGEDALELEAWLEDLKGEKGNDGITPYINEEGFWVVNNAPTTIKAKGENGKSAYDLYKETAGDDALELEEWLEDLKADPVIPRIDEITHTWWINGEDTKVQAIGLSGDSAYDVYVRVELGKGNEDYLKTEEAWVASLTIRPTGIEKEYINDDTTDGYYKEKYTFEYSDGSQIVVETDLIFSGVLDRYVEGLANNKIVASIVDGKLVFDYPQNVKLITVYANGDVKEEAINLDMYDIPETVESGNEYVIALKDYSKLADAKLYVLALSEEDLENKEIANSFVYNGKNEFEVAEGQTIDFAGAKIDCYYQGEYARYSLGEIAMSEELVYGFATNSQSGLYPIIVNYYHVRYVGITVISKVASTVEDIEKLVSQNAPEIVIDSDITITENNNITIPEETTLTISADKKLEIAEITAFKNDGTIVNDGEIVIDDVVAPIMTMALDEYIQAVVNVGTIINNGTIVNNGNFVSEGTIINNGTITNNGYIATAVRSREELIEAPKFANVINVESDIESATDISITSKEKDYNFILDLKGHTIGAELNLCNHYENEAKESIFCEYGLKAVVTSSIGVGKIGNNNSTNAFYGMLTNGNEKLDIRLENLEITGYYGALHANGLCANAKIEAVNCTFKVANTTEYDGAVLDATGAYLASGAEYTFDNCTFEAPTGLIIKSGESTLKGCTIIATDNNYELPRYYGGGFHATGDALTLLCDKGYNVERLIVTLEGCTLTSKAGYAIEQATTSGTIYDDISITIDKDTKLTSNVLKAPIKVEDESILNMLAEYSVEIAEL